MSTDKTLLSGNTAMLILSLINERDMYGYEMIEELSSRSSNVFSLKAGTLYPLLRTLEEKGYITSYEQTVGASRIRKYYAVTKTGKAQLKERQNEWKSFSLAVNSVMNGGALLVREF